MLAGQGAAQLHGSSWAQHANPLPLHHVPCNVANKHSSQRLSACVECSFWWQSSDCRRSLSSSLAYCPLGETWNESNRSLQPGLLSELTSQWVAVKAHPVLLCNGVSLGLVHVLKYVNLHSFCFVFFQCFTFQLQFLPFLLFLLPLVGEMVWLECSTGICGQYFISDEDKECIWLLFLGGNMIWSCVSCRWKVFTLSAVAESGILCFTAKHLEEKKCYSPSPPPICPISMWKARWEGEQVRIFLVVRIKAKINSVLFLMKYRNSQTLLHKKIAIVSFWVVLLSELFPKPF